VSNLSYGEPTVKRILVSCLAIAGGIGVLLAASPEAERAIDKLRSVGRDAEKVKWFCWWQRESLRISLESARDYVPPEVTGKRQKELYAKLPPDVSDAILEGDGGFESARDEREYDAAWKALTRRCPKR
jgi:hypothetical protein